MPRHAGLPRATPLLLRKQDVFDGLRRVDSDPGARDRILAMENEFRRRVDVLIGGLPSNDAKLEKFSTSPFVLMFYSKQKSYAHVADIEQALVPAKVFSSMETSAGNMIEKIVLPVYGWEAVESAMQTHDSLLDGRLVQQGSGTFVGATLKSGPRTLNDDMAGKIGAELVQRASLWAVDHGARQIEFTYGALYGTKKQSNKKDWHILRHVAEQRPRQSTLTQSHEGSWSISYDDGPLSVSATVRVGLEWWEYLGGPDAWLELCCALIRACIAPTTAPTTPSVYTISDLAEILDLSTVPAGYNVSVLQHSQLEWLLFLARHFCDGFEG